MKSRIDDQIRLVLALTNKMPRYIYIGDTDMDEFLSERPTIVVSSGGGIMLYGGAELVRVAGVSGFWCSNDKIGVG